MHAVGMVSVGRAVLFNVQVLRVFPIHKPLDKASYRRAEAGPHNPAARDAPRFPFACGLEQPNSSGRESGGSRSFYHS